MIILHNLCFIYNPDNPDNPYNPYNPDNPRHMLAELELLKAVPVITIDTLHLFPETYNLISYFRAFSDANRLQDAQGGRGGIGENNPNDPNNPTNEQDLHLALTLLNSHSIGRNKGIFRVIRAIMVINFYLALFLITLITLPDGCRYNNPNNPCYRYRLPCL